ncbi:hypothetical protein [Methylobacterium sp. J-068]|uniref:hypothetical protein n=1 Tax=Methylobacterium sp. J-068 TaxID=2836649 RepID=UPI001FBA2ED6|nr:hypothetical protein [Methylobacterium sp. J-068]MCJ2033852.1 hypothetical protein [Methylobacterium sp. J-068]
MCPVQVIARSGARLLVVLAIVALPARAGASRQDDAASRHEMDRRPLVKRPPRGGCIEPGKRILCKRACADALAACGGERTACAAEQAACVTRCPPKLCSRGRAGD